MRRGSMALGGATLLTTAALVRFGRRSGATAAEGRMPLPGDDKVPRPRWQSTRAVTIAAPPAAVWPWVVQMGFPPHRAGWYTPHLLDRLMWGDRPKSADRIVPDLQDLRVGDLVPDSADWSVFYDVVEVEPPHHLVLHSVRHVFGPVRRSSFTWVFVCEPSAAGGTRLLVRARVSYEPLWSAAVIEPMLDAGDFVNVSFMLAGIKRRAEDADPITTVPATA